METRATNPWLKFIPVFIAVFCTIMVIPKSTKRFTTEASKPKEQAWPIQSTENKNDKLKCMEGKYVIWQPHYSGLGSNLVIGLGNAAKYAAYAQRELIIGMPAPGWMYLNVPRTAIGPGAYDDQQEHFWDYYIDFKHPCADFINELAGTRISSIEELKMNAATVVVLNLDQGPQNPSFMDLYSSGKIRGQLPPKYFHGEQQTVARLLDSFSYNVRVGFLMRELAIFVEFGVPNCLSLPAPYIAFHMRGGDKETEVNLPRTSMFFDEVKAIDSQRNIACPLFLAGNVEGGGMDRIIANRSKNSFRFPIDTVDPGHWTRDATRCDHPCRVVDALFDVEMFGRAELLIGTAGSGFSELGFIKQRTHHRGKLEVESASLSLSLSLYTDYCVFVRSGLGTAGQCAPRRSRVRTFLFGEAEVYFSLFFFFGNGTSLGRRPAGCHFTEGNCFCGQRCL